MSDPTALIESDTTGNGLVPLTARLAPWMRSIIASDEIHTLLERYGSPLNIQNSEPFEQNLSALSNTAARHGLAFKPFFARKANKCLTYAVRSLAVGCGIDTASLQEIRQCLRLGFSGPDIVCTAAVKDQRLLQQCLQSNITIIIDNNDELDLVLKLIGQTPYRAKVGLRVCAFSHDGQMLHSRFGFPLCRLQTIVSRLRNEACGTVDLIGLHFHLSGYDAGHRVSAIRQLLPHLKFIERAQSERIFLDIGGGIPMRYLEIPAQWDAWCIEHEKALLGDRAPITRTNHGIGKSVHNNMVLGKLDAYPPAHQLVQDQWLDRILSAPVTEQQPAGRPAHSIAQALVELDIELRCEPGRSALDGCGITVGRVQFTKRDSAGEWVIGLTMNRTQCRSGFLEFMVDPILVRRQRESDPAKPPFPIQGYLAGTYCTESEWLSLRKFKFPHGVKAGDLLVFPNTAGYLMHFLESRSHQFDLAKNLFVSIDKGKPTFTLDVIDREEQARPPGSLCQTGQA